jgi:hypothetical protein
MKRAYDVSKTVGILVSVLVIAAAAACGGSKTGIPTGAGGASVGGTTATDGGAPTGTGGATGAAGSGTGGLTIIAGSTGGILGTGGKATGGASGSGGRTTLVPGTGGHGVDAGTAGAGAGGRGTGGRTAGGTGGAAVGGATGLDGGTPAKCSDITTQTECDARGDCHSVFEDPQICDCMALGCCARFRSCADGEKADCTGPALCEIVEPYCEGPYVIAYRGACYEGCVKQTDCTLPVCPQAPPRNGAACGPLTQTCYYEDCAGAGRTMANCTSGAWKVKTSACATVDCEIAPDIDPSGIICPAGQICILTDSSGALPPMTTATCVDHTCGTGPITSECVPNLHGDCTATYKPEGAVFRCQLPTP